MVSPPWEDLYNEYYRGEVQDLPSAVIFDIAEERGEGENSYRRDVVETNLRNSESARVRNAAMAGRHSMQTNLDKHYEFAKQDAKRIAIRDIIRDKTDKGIPISNISGWEEEAEKDYGGTKEKIERLEELATTARRFREETLSKYEEAIRNESLSEVEFERIRNLGEAQTEQAIQRGIEALEAKRITIEGPRGGQQKAVLVPEGRDFLRLKFIR